MPVEPFVLLAFLPAALALNLTPGIDMMFCLGQGLRSGARAGIAASAGISVGGLVHALVAGLGVAALLATMPAVLVAVKWAGAAYLIWLAWQSVARGPAEYLVPGLAPWRAFRDGLLINLANPKVLLFILAFLPQFVDPERPVLPQFLTLGAVFSAGGFVVNGCVGAFAGSLSGLLRAPGPARALRIVSALIFVALALRLVVDLM